MLATFLGSLGSVSASESSKENYEIDFVFFDKNEVTSFNNNHSVSANISSLLLVSEYLPKKVVLKPMPLERIWRHFDSERPVCSPALIKTKARAEKYLFSLPTAITLSARVFTRKDEFTIGQDLGGETVTMPSLQSFFDKHPQARVFFSGSRSYGDEFDKQLAELEPSNKEEIYSPSYFGRDIDLFLKGRGDILIATPVVVDRYFKDFAHSLNSYSLAQSKQYILGHFMCNDTPQTKAFLSDLNAALLRLYRSEAFRLTHMNQHSEDFQRELMQYFGLVINDLLEK